MIFGRSNARYLIYLQVVVMGISIAFILSKIRHVNNIHKISLDSCNDENLLVWAANHEIRSNLSLGNFVYEDLTGKKKSYTRRLIRIEIFGFYCLTLNVTRH